MNVAIRKNDIPKGWKSALNVPVPVHKAGSRRTPDNFRPISTLPLTTKILESCVHTQVIDYLSKEEILTQYQFGFRGLLYLQYHNFVVASALSGI